MNVYKLGLGLLAIGLLAGCASSPQCDQPRSGEKCHTEQLLYQNDMLQAKLLIASGDLNNYELAAALLERAAKEDKRGEAHFYQAILKILEGPQVDEVLDLLDQAADEQQPYAVALLYKIYAEPYLIADADPQRAEEYRERYEGLDVAKSGYPSFEKATILVNNLIAPSLPTAEQDALNPAAQATP